MQSSLENRLVRLAFLQPSLQPYLCSMIRKSSLDKTALRVKEFRLMLAMPGEFGVMTAYGPYSKSVNKDRQSDLIKDLQAKGYKFEWLKGSWGGVRENSLLIKNMSHKDLFDLGRKYEQDSVIHKNKSGVVAMYYLKENKVELAIKPDASIAGEIETGDGLYSKSRGTSFSFDFLWGQKMDWDGHKSIDKNQVKQWVADGKLNPVSA